MQDYVVIGSTKKPFGVHGELKVDIADAYLEDFLQAKVLFLKVKGKPVPYFVENIRMGGTPLLKLEEVDDKETAATIGARELLLRKGDLLSPDQRQLEVEPTFHYQDCLGFTIVDAKEGELGTIQEIAEFPQQEMAVTKYQGREILIPLHPLLIDSIDPEKKEVLMTLPEGLLEL